MNTNSSISLSSLTIDDIPPIPPARIPKRVSFSDELPTSDNRGTTAEPFNPISDVLKQTSAYMENLHKIYNDNINSQDTTDHQHLRNHLHQKIINSSSKRDEPPPDVIVREHIDNDDPLPPSPTNQNLKILKVKQDSSPAILTSYDPAPCCSKTDLSQLDEIALNEKMQAQNGLTNYLDRYNLKPADKNCSLMEKENRRDKIRWLLISECSAMFGDNKHTREGFRKIVLNEDFMAKFFHLFDLDGDGVLEQDVWIEHLKGRLKDEGQIDFSELLESVAYAVCGESAIMYKGFAEVWHTRGVVDKMYRLIDVDGTNLVSTNQIMEFLSNLTNSRARMGFDKSSLERLESLFKKTVGNEEEIHLEEFKKIVTSKNPFFTERVFQIFDKDNSGSISLQEFIDSIHQFSGQSADDKIRFLFKVYDIDGDGLIQHKELHDVISACIKENGMEFSEEQIEDLTMAMFDDADPQHKGSLTYEALKDQLQKHGGLLENLSITIDRWLVPQSKSQENKKPKCRFQLPHQFTKAYLKNNYVFVLYLASYFLVNLILFVTRSIQYRYSNGYTIIARACGQCLNFNCAWVLVLMLRHSLTFLRSRGFSSYLPIDHHIYLHKVTGMVIAVLSLVHTFMHLLNFCIEVVNDPEINANNYTTAQWLFTSTPGLFGLVAGWANPTGFALFFILLVMFLCSLPFIRRKGSFEIFYWTHLLYIPFWFLVILHGPNFWKWFIIPGFIYLVERIMRFVWMKSKRGKTYISSGLLLPSKVTHLVIKRPSNFTFRPGDYAFINIPNIAKYEWHPFTISSCPEEEDYIWLHIRGVGEWTNRLYFYFEKEQEKLHNGEIEPYIAEMRSEKSESKTPQLDFLAKNLSNIKRSDVNELPSPMRPPRHGPSKLATESITANHNEEVKNTVERKTLKNLRNTLQRTFSRKDAARKDSSDLHELHINGKNKTPLEKSLSMPNIANRTHRRLRVEYYRSESAKSFDEDKIRRAHFQNLGLAYLSPQNKSLAQSFRYMRNKPTIIAFKTPSLESCEKRDSSNSMASTIYSQKEAEEGRIHSKTASQRSGVNYPVGKPLKVYIDGPYGAPSSHIFSAQHAVLIGTGIGVTPFASILQSIMHRYLKGRHTCPCCKHEFVAEIPMMNLKKVDFFWINRDQRSFEWFVNLLSKFEIEQAELGGAMERFLDMHMYITSALQRTDMKAVGLQLALDLLHEKVSWEGENISIKI
ncbi:NOX5 family protein [Megaselia abdita]